MGKNPRTDTRARTDKRTDGKTHRQTCLNGSQPNPQVNAKCDVAMKLSVFGTRTDTHTRLNLYILTLRAVNRGVLVECSSPLLMLQVRYTQPVYMGRMYDPYIWPVHMGALFVPQYTGHKHGPYIRVSSGHLHIIHYPTSNITVS